MSTDLGLPTAIRDEDGQRPPTTPINFSPKCVTEINKILDEHPRFRVNTEFTRNLVREWAFNSMLATED